METGSIIELVFPESATQYQILGSPVTGSKKPNLSGSILLEPCGRSWIVARAIPQLSDGSLALVRRRSVGEIPSGRKARCDLLSSFRTKQWVRRSLAQRSSAARPRQAGVACRPCSSCTSPAFAESQPALATRVCIYSDVIRDLDAVPSKNIALLSFSIRIIIWISNPYEDAMRNKQGQHPEITCDALSKPSIVPIRHRGRRRHGSSSASNHRPRVEREVQRLPRELLGWCRGLSSMPPPRWPGRTAMFSTSKKANWKSRPDPGGLFPTVARQLGLFG